MCGRFTLTSAREDLVKRFDLDELPELAPRFNIAPTQDVAVVRADVEGVRHLSMLRWGLIPFWAKDPKIGNRMINARAESVADKPAYRDCLRFRRCLVPASGFYEWGGKGAARRPYLYGIAEGGVFGIAGLWDRWRAQDGERTQSCTLITTEANSLVRPIHDRMPVILHPRDFQAWLDPENRETDWVRSLLVPCPPDWLTATAVSQHVNNVDNDDPACIEPAELPSAG